MELILSNSIKATINLNEIEYFYDDGSFRIIFKKDGTHIKVKENTDEIYSKIIEEKHNKNKNPSF